MAKKRPASQLSSDLKAQAQELGNFMQNKLPRFVANDALHIFDDSWDKKGFTDGRGVFHAWSPRKPNEMVTEQPNNSLMIGKGSGFLRKSLFVKQAKLSGIVIGTMAPYAQIHNEGGIVKQEVIVTPKMRKLFWRKWFASGDDKDSREEKFMRMALAKKLNRTLNIPQRQFMGDSKRIDARIQHRLDNFMNRVMR